MAGRTFYRTTRAFGRRRLLRPICPTTSLFERGPRDRPRLLQRRRALSPAACDARAMRVR